MAGYFLLWFFGGWPGALFCSGVYMVSARWLVWVVVWGFACCGLLGAGAAFHLFFFFFRIMVSDSFTLYMLFYLILSLFVSLWIC